MHEKFLMEAQDLLNTLNVKVSIFIVQKKTEVTLAKEIWREIHYGY